MARSNHKASQTAAAEPELGLVPAADRVVATSDNAPPGSLQQLATAEELPIVMKERLDALTAEALEHLGTFSRMPDVIADDKTYELATTFGTIITTLLSDIDKARKKVKEPYLAATNAIDGAFKLVVPANGDVPARQLAKELEVAKTSIKSRMSARDTQIHLAEQKRIAEERAKLAEAAAADGIIMGEAPSATPRVEVVKSVHGGSAVRSVVTNWEVEDEAALPRSILSVDPAKVQALIGAGVTTIPGIRLSTSVETHVKRR